MANFATALQRGNPVPEKLLTQVGHDLISSRMGEGTSKMPNYGGKGVKGFITSVSHVHLTEIGTMEAAPTQTFDENGKLIFAGNTFEKGVSFLKNNSYGPASGIVQNITTAGLALPDIARAVFQDWKREEFVPIEQGFGAWKSEVYQYATQPIGADQFRKGLKTLGQTASNNLNNIEIFQQAVPLMPWSQGYDYDIFEANFALANGIPLNIIEEKQRALMLMFRYGMMETSFLGIPGNPLPGGRAFNGLFNNADVTLNTSVMVNGAAAPTKLSAMTDAEFFTAVEGMINTYITNVQETHRTRPANFLAIPEDERVTLALQPIALSNTLGLNTGVSQVGISRLDYMQNAFQKIFTDTDFKIRGTSYLQANSQGELSLGYYAYMLYRNDPSTLVQLDSIPFTLATMATPNGYNFVQMAYAQFSPVFFKRPQEAIIFQVAP